MNKARGSVLNIFTADIEEYYQVEAFSGYIKSDEWDKYPERVERNTECLLEIMDLHDVKGTFFIVGWLAERKPGLVKMISRKGHEISSHGYSHTMVTKMTPREFREDIRRAKEILEGITGEKVIGYRAPTFSIVKDTSWAYDILLQEGYRYSSSVFPIRHDRYGWPDFGVHPKIVARGGEIDLWEIPLTVFLIGKIKIPFGGGGYLRAYPLFLTRFFFEHVRQRGRSPILYVHPWELDRNHPKIALPFYRTIRHYQGISSTEYKLRNILSARPFVTMKSFVDSPGKSD